MVLGSVSSRLMNVTFRTHAFNISEYSHYVNHIKEYY